MIRGQKILHRFDQSCETDALNSASLVVSEVHFVAPGDHKKGKWRCHSRQMLQRPVITSCTTSNLILALI